MCEVADVMAELLPLIRKSTASSFCIEPLRAPQYRVGMMQSGHPSSTIHRLPELLLQDGGNEYCACSNGATTFLYSDSFIMEIG